MQLILNRKIFLLAIFVLVMSTSFYQGMATTQPVSNQKILKSTSTTADGSILTIEKRINKTVVEVNESIFIELILKNEGENPIYNINLTEKRINNPEIVTTNLFSPIPFAVFEPHEQRIISYSIISRKVANITLLATSATFQQVEGGPIYQSLSRTSFIQVKAKTVTLDEANLKNLLVVSVLAVFYIVILIFRILFKLFRKAQPST